MVGEALVVAAGEGGVDGVGGLALPGLAEDLVEDADVQLVDLVVLVADLLRDARVLRAEEPR